MQGCLVAFSFLAFSSATRTSPQHGKLNRPADQAAPVQFLSAYDRLIKAAAEVEKLAGDASLLSKDKRSKAAAHALVQDPEKISRDALQLAAQAYDVMGSKPPAPQAKPIDELHAAYHEILAAAEGIELVRRRAATLAPEKVTAFAALLLRNGPDKVEQDVKTLKEDMEEAEEDVEAAEKKLKEAEATEEKTDDKDDVTEAEAANKAAKQALAEADHEKHGGHELVGKAEGDKARQEEHAAKKAEAKAEVEAATAEHKEADAVHEVADKADDKNEVKTAQAEENHAEAQDNHEEAVEAHAEHPDNGGPKKSEKSGAEQLASFAAVLTLAVFC